MQIVLKTHKERYNLILSKSKQLDKYIRDDAYTVIYVGDDPSVDAGVVDCPLTFWELEKCYIPCEFFKNSFSISLGGREILGMTDVFESTPDNVKIRPTKAEIEEFFKNFIIFPKKQIVKIK